MDTEVTEVNATTESEAADVTMALSDPEQWRSADWAKAEADVRRLRQRIFKAAREEDPKRVRNLQKLMLRSRSNTVVSIRRVTQLSAGRRTPGIDRTVVVNDEQRGKLLRELTEEPRFRPLPVRRVHTPKANGKKRPLGIPTIRDRVEQARVKNALEPEWEARFEGRSYGFRPGRGCHDAIGAIFQTLARKGAKKLWILDADLSSAFDRINHDHLLNAIENFPARREIEGWLKAGVMENGRFAPTEEGTPQGGVISPLLLNIALHGMETAAGYDPSLTQLQRSRKNIPTLVRYADDFVVMCATEAEAWQIKEKLTEWLKPRGLAFNDEKTQVVHASKGFDFLGFNVRRYDDKLLIKPSKAAVQKVKREITGRCQRMAGARTTDLIRNVNPLIKGWSTYYRSAVSSETFNKLDWWMYKRQYRWGKKRHAKKSRSWVKNAYFGRFNPTRQDNWVFGDKETGAFMGKFAWTNIKRHVMVKGAASKDDPDLAEYWRERTRKRKHPQADGKLAVNLAAKQRGICPLCGLDLIDGATYEPDSVRDWANWFHASYRTIHKHHLIYRSRGGSDHVSNQALVHSDCHRRHHVSHDYGQQQNHVLSQRSA